jgi:hypothetical protein
MRSLLVLITLTGVLCAAPIPKCLKKPRMNLNGTWELIDMKRPDRRTVTPYTMCWIIDGEQLKFEQSGSLDNDRLDTFQVINTKDDLLSIDWTMIRLGKTIGSYVCVASLQDDTLLLSAGTGRRPEKADVTQDTLLYTFKRADGK